MTKKNVLAVLVLVLLVVVSIGVQLCDGDDDSGVHQTDRDTVMDQAPLESPIPPRPPAGRTGEGP